MARKFDWFAILALLSFYTCISGQTVTINLDNYSDFQEHGWVGEYSGVETAADLPANAFPDNARNLSGTGLWYVLPVGGAEEKLHWKVSEEMFEASEISMTFTYCTYATVTLEPVKDTIIGILDPSEVGFTTWNTQSFVVKLRDWKKEGKDQDFEEIIITIMPGPDGFLVFDRILVEYVDLRTTISTTTTTEISTTTTPIITTTTVTTTSEPTTTSQSTTTSAHTTSQSTTTSASTTTSLSTTTSALTTTSQSTTSQSTTTSAGTTSARTTTSEPTTTSARTTTTPARTTTSEPTTSGSTTTTMATTTPARTTRNTTTRTTTMSTIPPRTTTTTPTSTFPPETTLGPLPQFPGDICCPTYLGCQGIPNTECALQHNNTYICICIKGSDLSNDARRCILKAEFVEDLCENNLQCTELPLTSCQQSNSTGLSYCSCNPGTVVSSSFRACLPIAEKIGDECLEKSQCQTGIGNTAYCDDNFCQCISGYVSSSNRLRCLRVSLIGEHCEEPIQCTELHGIHSRCEPPSQTCACVPGAGYLNIEGPCYRKQSIGAICNSTEECILGVNELAHCNPENNRCICRPMAIPDKNSCYADLNFGDTCQNDGECMVPIEGPVFCDARDKICICKFGYKPLTGLRKACVSGSNLASVSSSLILFIMLIIYLNKLY